MNSKMETRAFIWLLLLVSVGFLWVLKPFFGPIFWACAVAIIFYPVQQRLLNKFNQRENIAALTTLLLCLVIVILPVIFIITSVVAEGVGIYQKLDKGDIDLEQYIDRVQESFPVIQSVLDRFNISIDELQSHATDAAMATGKFLAQHTLDIGQNAFRFVLNICLMVYLTFFMLRDGSRLLELLIKALPIGDERERLLFRKFAEVTRATVKGNIVVAAVQGGLGGIIFWLLDIPAPMLWGVVMAFASLIPAVGAAIIWAPVAIYLLATGDYTQGIILVAFGAGVIGLVDNILRPILVGRDTKLPDYVVLLSTLGGIALFGINGFVMGPLVAALFVAFWGIFVREFNSENTLTGADRDSLEHQS
ncbi:MULTISPECIES: AI-2E family transporter [unclassified Marinimicrobium]|jgi:predicted PurR-regulated permease PerM|uniref:AI-2E family transporter n=1 Tax=unclassified Marinimicrobium TaxID=2632100 RepID=UPI000C613446|nr:MULTISPECIES: AI-2E family transporter [unclassified Marinimicrobium]MAN52421.1 AI-2E family transporter [Marinimicrobium sp.]